MELQSQKGILLCPKCNTEGFKFNKYYYKRWICRIECGKNNKQTKKWIIYNKSSKWACCICCFCLCEEVHSLSVVILRWHKCHICLFICCFPFYLLFLILYIVFSFLLDLFTFIFCQKKEFIDVCYRAEDSSEEIKQKNFIIAKDMNSIFLKVTGFSEEEWNSKKYVKGDFYTDSFDNICRCPNCKYSSKSFIDFVSNKIVINSKDTIIAVNISSSKFNWPVPCKLNDKFSSIENKFYKEYPQYKNKKCFFTANGQRLKPEQTLSENGIRNGDTILINCSEF